MYDHERKREKENEYMCMTLCATLVWDNEGTAVVANIDLSGVRLVMISCLLVIIM